MAIELTKGGRTLLLSKNSGPRNFRVALGWKTAAPGDAGMDLDVFAFLVKGNGQVYPNGAPVKKVTEEANMVYWGSELRTENQKTTFIDTTKINVNRGIEKKGFPSSPNCGIVHLGDNLTGTADGSAAETLIIRPEFIPVEAGDEIAIIVEINEARRRRQTFSMVTNAFIELFDADSGESLGRFQLKEDFGAKISAHFGSIWLKPDADDPTAIGEAEFEAVGEPYDKTLSDYADLYVF